MNIDAPIGITKTRLFELVNKVRPLTLWGEGLASLIMSQHYLRTRIEGRTAGADKNTVRTTAFALIVEITELTQKLGWKPWRRDAEPSTLDILDEFADVTAYYGTLAGIVMQRTGCTIQDLENAYFKKYAENWERFSGKVPGYIPQIPQSESQTLAPDKDSCSTCGGSGHYAGHRCTSCDGD